MLAYFAGMRAACIPQAYVQARLMLTYMALMTAQSNNKLNGTIPSMQGLTKMVTFMVDHNQLTGSIPEGWLQSPTLAVFSAESNLLSGTLPTPQTLAIGFIGGATPAPESSQLLAYMT